MKKQRPTRHHASSIALGLLLALCGFMIGCGKSSGPGVGSGDLQAAIKARTEVTERALEVLKTDEQIRDLMRKVIAKADAKQTEGNILLTKDRYPEAVEAFNESARLYRQVADGKIVLDQLAKAEIKAATARMLAGATAKPEQLNDARRLETNAEGYLQAGEFEPALAEYEKARDAYAKLLPSEGEATLEQAVAARTAMLAARDQIKNLPPIGSSRNDDLQMPQRRLGVANADIRNAPKEPKPGSFSGLTSGARKAESAASDALEDRQYTQARALFVVAEKLYREAAVAQGKREAILTSRQSAEDTMKKADVAFRGSARPASFERGKQVLADADKALAEDDFETAKPLLTAAAEQFAVVRGEAEQMNTLADAQQAWSAALAAADEDLLNKHASSDFQAAKAQAAAAQTQAASGQVPLATAQFKLATTALAAAVAAATTKKETTAKAAPVIAQLDSAVAGGDKFGAEDILAELEILIPSDPRMDGLRDKVTAMPAESVDLGGGVRIELVLIRPGSFMMGSDSGNGDEKPVHKVTLTQPFHLGKFKVTQEQWQAVMGSNPSNFKGPKLPVENLSWDDCQGFMAKLQEKTGRKFVLPTEAQWEYACRAGTTGDYAGNLDAMAWYNQNSGGTTHPVGQKQPNAWGLYDMHGNVWEWCRDWYGNYPGGSVTDPTGPPQGSLRVIRGGCWGFVAGYCRSAFRGRIDPGIRYVDLGFRLALAP